MRRVTLLKSRFSHRGGLEKYTLRLAQAFVEAGCKVNLLTTIDPHAFSIPGVTIIPVAPTSKFTLYHLLQFDEACKKWLKKHPQDIVFGLERTTSQTHYRAGSGVHKVFLKRRSLVDGWWKRMTFAINPLHKTLLYLEKKALENPALKVLFTNSEMVKEEVLETYDVSPTKIEVVHNGVEWKEWEEPFYQTFDKEREELFHFLFIGNGYRRKGLEFLLRGLSLLPIRDFKVSIIGKDKETAYFQKIVHSLAMDSQVSFFGPQQKILPFYQAADVLVIPSIYDPFANVTVEALAMGLFVVSSRYNGGKEVLTTENGILIESLTSPESIAEALKKALNHKKTLSSAEKIRLSIQRLDFSQQLNKIVAKTLFY